MYRIGSPRSAALCVRFDENILQIARFFELLSVSRKIKLPIKLPNPQENRIKSRKYSKLPLNLPANYMQAFEIEL